MGDTMDRRQLLAVLGLSPVVSLAGNYDWPPLYPWPELPKSKTDDRPVVKFFTSKSCAPCREAKKVLTEGVRKGLPFRLVEIDTEVSNEWDGKVPAFVWETNTSNKYIIGFPGVDSLVAAWQASRINDKITVPRDYRKRVLNWTGPDGHYFTNREQVIRHLLWDSPHIRKFQVNVLNGLDFQELIALHSDDHEGRVSWSFLK